MRINWALGDDLMKNGRMTSKMCPTHSLPMPHIVQFPTKWLDMKIRQLTFLRKSPLARNFKAKACINHRLP